MNRVHAVTYLSGGSYWLDGELPVPRSSVDEPASLEAISGDIRMALSQMLPGASVTVLIDVNSSKSAHIDLVMDGDDDQEHERLCDLVTDTVDDLIEGWRRERLVLKPGMEPKCYWCGRTHGVNGSCRHSVLHSHLSLVASLLECLHDDDWWQLHECLVSRPRGSWIHLRTLMESVLEIDGESDLKDGVDREQLRRDALVALYRDAVL